MGKFLKICNKPIERSHIFSALIISELVNTASHLVSMQSSKLIMTLAKHLVPKDRVVKSVIGEIFLHLHPKNIEKVFHLPRVINLLGLPKNK